MKSVIVFLFLFSTYFFYLYLRRGSYDLNTFNQSFGETSLTVLGIVLLLGPLSRFYEILDRWLSLRKSLGILAFAAALMHGIISFFFLPDRFPLSYYLSNPIGFPTGLVALTTLFVLFILSFERFISRMDRTLWWKIQYWGLRITVLLAFLHTITLRYNSWVRWFQSGSGGVQFARPYLPPAGLLTISFVGMVILVRIIEFTVKNKAKAAIPAFYFLWVILVAGLFGWGAGLPIGLPRP